MKILAIDTSCDETAAAVTEDTKILSNVIWSQASAHAKFGGVMPSLAQRMHEERIDFVIAKSLKQANLTYKQVDAIAVTIGPGLSIALGVGVNKAKFLAKKYDKPLIPVNHIEAHLLSPLATSKLSLKPNNVKFPCYGLCVSGGNTIFVLIKNIGDYKIIAETVDDALGEALDKGARMLGLGYPGGALLEKLAKNSEKNIFNLPIPLVGQEKRLIFSYSGLKTSFYRLLLKNKNLDENFPSKNDLCNLAATFQDISFKHIERILSFYMSNQMSPNPEHFLLGGGVAANTELRKRLRSLGDNFGWTVHIPHTKRLCGDNAGMVGVTAFLRIKALKLNLNDFINANPIDRNPKLKLV